MSDDMTTAILALAEVKKHPDRYRGLAGDQGIPGIQGDKGDAGPRGPVGPAGADGKDGRDGLDGLPGLVWQGPWQEGTAYRPRDVVEQAGSSWVALSQTRTRPPGKAWDLVAKKGTDGRDGRNGLNGGGGGGGGGTVGPQGPKGDTGDTGPQGPPGDPASNLVDSVNGQTGVVVLDADDVGATLEAVLIAGNDANGQMVVGVPILAGTDADGVTVAGSLAAGTAQIFAGSADGDNGGAITISGGSAIGGSDGDGGNLELNAGAGQGAGDNGYLVIAVGLETADPAYVNSIWADQGHLAQTGATPLGTAAFSATGDFVAAGAGGLTQPQVMARTLGC